MNDVFHALAHDARRAMLARLASGDLTVGQLAEPFSMSLEAASKHIRVLERAGLVRRTVEGRRHICRLSPAPLASAYSWLRFYERFWTRDSMHSRSSLLPARRRKGRNDDPEEGTAPAVRLERVIPAPPHEVYRAWLDPALLRQWMAPGLRRETRRGRRARGRPPPHLARGRGLRRGRLRVRDRRARPRRAHRLPVGLRRPRENRRTCVRLAPDDHAAGREGKCHDADPPARAPGRSRRRDAGRRRQGGASAGRWSSRSSPWCSNRPTPCERVGQNV